MKNIERWEDYKSYHIRMIQMGDCDPAYPALNYLANRFDLNIEQRYWIAWLYGCCYCVPTVFYVYNEFPDYENVDVRRLDWWWNKNKSRLLFQTDRLKMKSFNKFIPAFQSYRERVGLSQEKAFTSLLKDTPESSYDAIYKFSGELYYFGRYSLFLYLEAMHELTGINIQPTGLDLKHAESCRNGLCYALGMDELVEKTPSKEEYLKLYEGLKALHDELEEKNPGLGISYWNIETSLCAYKKMYWSARYLGYYIDRQAEEISKMEKLVPEGVDWSVLWDFRREYFDERNLIDKVRKNLMGKYKEGEVDCFPHKALDIKMGGSYENISSSDRRRI